MILQKCERLQPGIASSPVVSDKVGLRPCRRGGVRCEVDIVKGPLLIFEPFHMQMENILSVGGKRRVVIHNYGHGGSGVTLSWGCAGQVLQILERYLQNNPL